jgi:Protein of unknown function (DUF1496)
MPRLLLLAILSSIAAPGIAAAQDTPMEISPAVAIVVNNKLADFCIYNDRVYSVNAVICVGKNATQRCVRGQKQNEKEQPAAWSDPAGNLACDK